ncbi:VOC family protein [Micromonospora sp. WMMD812]|uniref:VOC family protein n=1 Tax=Micromonospora sp. WMMD812 TaxID=3015152 RepID=UPI00248CD0D0|nr:VOC family protein [Micromonospora sp. WMMD812]WBB65112.1 VOC family protein [Micromonospora sp. WMMD812]
MGDPWSMTFDSANPPALAAFWKTALGYVDAAPPAGFADWASFRRHYDVPEEEWDDVAYLADPSGRGPRISFLRVPEAKVAKNRIHLDIQAGGGRGVAWEVRAPRVRAAVERLIAAGATMLREDEVDGRLDHVVMADPEGNEFCVV